jgi:hypothetical protein
MMRLLFMNGLWMVGTGVNHIECLPLRVIPKE